MSVIQMVTNFKASQENSRSRQTLQSCITDPKLLIAALILLGLGLVMVASSSTSIAERQVADPLYFFWRQSVYSVLGILAAVAAWKVPLDMLEKTGPVLIILSIVMLVLVLIPGIGKEVNGSIRWINLGVFSLQVSEFVKLFTVIYLAGYMVRHTDEVRERMGGFVRPLLLMLVIAMLLLLEPDYGAVAVLMMTAMGMLWLGGARIFQFVLLFLTMAAALAVIAVLSPYRMERLTAFLNPWADPFNSGFQLTQALIAFGRGEWFGVGLGASVQKLFYLPEAHTDFVFAVLAEELGLFSALIVILLFAYVVVRALIIGRNAEKRDRAFAAYLAYGLGIWIGLQAFINIGVNMGVLPTKGLTLPFMSYGGSSLVVMCMAIALILRVDYETHKEDRTVQRKGIKTW